MSDDLISRKELLGMERLLMTGIVKDNPTARYILEQVLYDIENTEAVYDVDKVINMLKEREEHAEIKAAEYDEKDDIPMMDIWDTEAKSYRNSIEIVKSGGVADE